MAPRRHAAGPTRPDVTRACSAARRLHWPDCQNVRDLGGLPTADGGRIRAGALIRADSLARLSDTGLAALRASGVRRVLDVRGAAEAAAEPSRLAGDPMYRLMPMIDPGREAERDRDAEHTLAEVYRNSVERNAGHIAAGVAAIADAPAGGVLVHCASGKDRTGMITAMVLRLAGVLTPAISADYAYSAVCLRDRFAAQLAAVPDRIARERLRERQTSRPETILTMLDHLDRRYGAVSAYLLAHGLTDDQILRLRTRLRD